MDGNPLGGTIPVELGNLRLMEHLFLRDAGLTGSIPTELTQLTNMTNLFLEGNSLTGCIPPALRSLDHHDLNTIALPDCSP